MEDLKELTPEELADLTPEELTDRLLEQNKIAVANATRVKEVQRGAEMVATELNELKGKKQTEKPVEDVVKEQLEESKVTEKLDSYLAQIPEENREVFKATFDEIVGANKVTAANIDKFVKAAIANLDDGNADAIKASAIGGSSGSNKSVSATTKFAEQQKEEGMKLFWNN